MIHEPRPRLLRPLGDARFAPFTRALYITTKYDRYVVRIGLAHSQTGLAQALRIAIETCFIFLDTNVVLSGNVRVFGD